MSERFFIFKSFNLFLKFKPFRIVLIFLLTLVQGFIQGISIVLLIPLLGMLTPAETEDQPFWLSTLHSIFNKAGIDLNIEVVLIVFTLSLFVVAIITYFQQVWQSIYKQEFSTSIRQRLFRKIITSDWAFLNGKSKHNHIQMLTTEIPKMTMYYYYYLALAGKAIFITAHIILAIVVSPVFSLAIIAFGIIVFILLRKYLNKAQWLGSANIQVFRQMLKRIDDFWTTVKIAKVHNSEEFYYNKFKETNKQMLYYQNKQVTNRAVPQLLYTLAGIMSLVVLVYLSNKVFNLPISSLIVLILLFARIFPKFTGLNNDLNAMFTNLASVKVVLKAEQDLKFVAFKNEKTKGQHLLRKSIGICDLSFGYEPDKNILEQINETIPAGKITGIVGESGCGKTTLIDLIAGLHTPTKGKITIDNVPLTSELLPAWKNKIGYLPQDPFFIDGTLRENLIWDSRMKHTDAEIIKILEQVNIEDVVFKQASGLDTNIVNYQYHFSGGERQRLALARVLLREPDVLLLDEATSALDPENEARIMECLIKLKNNVTIIFVTHRRSLHPYFDKIIYLEKLVPGS